MSKWVVKKVLCTEEYKVEFLWYLDDNSERVRNKNRIQVYRDGCNVGHMSVQDNFGNWCYNVVKEAIALGRDLEEVTDDLWLENCAFYDDFGSYSDLYKDIHNFRPHYTHDEWDNVVRTARKRGC